MQRPLSLILLFLSTFLAPGAGKQLGGVYTPAQTPPLSPREAQKKFTLPPGFEIRLFAAEPDVINPVAMTWDERGRLWVVELFEYPLGAAPGTKGRDRIKILEDTDGDGRADTFKMFADGLNLATGIQIGYGGVFVGQAPYLLFLEDTNGDDVADKSTVLLNGFGRQDTHELLNSFTWGPDGWLYMTQGVFTKSKAKDPTDPTDDGVYLDGGVGRYHPVTKTFEVFADGTSNPWGVDFDRHGNAFVSACVIDHFFHLSPGGIYVRQAATPANPFAYELLPSIVDHKHFRAAYAGVQIYQGDQFPAAYKGTVFMGNIHGNQINHDRLQAAGSTFKAQANDDFLVANDGWFRPVSEQVGPDGSLWVMDWYDKYPCYQNAMADPEGVDREHGRVWRVLYTGDEKGKKIPTKSHRKMNLSREKSQDLVELLDHPNIWQRRTAQRLLSERRDAGSRKGLQRLFTEGKTVESRLAALWTLHGSGLLDEPVLDQAAADLVANLRAWAARLTGERGDPSELALGRLNHLAGNPEPPVRVAVATALRQFTSGSLTVNTPSSKSVSLQSLISVLDRALPLEKEKDSLLRFMSWTALEPALAADIPEAMAWFGKPESDRSAVAAVISWKFMRRLCDTGKTTPIDQSVTLLQRLAERNSPLLPMLLAGMIEGQRAKPLPPSEPATALFAKLSASPNAEVVESGKRLGTLWGDASALHSLITTVKDASMDEGKRIQAIQGIRQSKTDPARDALLEVISRDPSDRVRIESIRSLTEVGGDTLGGRLLGFYSKAAVPVRKALVEALASRPVWTLHLLEALENKTVAASELPLPVIRQLTRHNIEHFRERAQKSIGRFNELDASKVQLIERKKQVVTQGEIDFQKGRELAQKNCLVCHKFFGEGAEVGPDLTGVGRASLDALLANVITPNQIVGQGYENTEIETKDGRIVSGRVIEDTDQRVKLLSAGPKEEVVSKSEIAARRTSELSLMPEGLEQITDEEFRNLIWYILAPPQERTLTPELRQQLSQ